MISCMKCDSNNLRWLSVFPIEGLPTPEIPSKGSESKIGYQVECNECECYFDYLPNNEKSEPKVCMVVDERLKKVIRI